MAQIQVYKGDDWVEVEVNGLPYCRGHSIPTSQWVELLKELGHEAQHAWVEYCSICCARLHPSEVAQADPPLCKKCKEL